MNFEIRGVEEKYRRSAKWRSDKATNGHTNLSNSIREMVAEGDISGAQEAMLKLYSRVYSFRKARKQDFNQQIFKDEYLDEIAYEVFDSIEQKKPKKEKEDPCMGISPSTLKATYEIAGIEVLRLLLVLAGKKPLHLTPALRSQSTYHGSESESSESQYDH